MKKIYPLDQWPTWLCVPFSLFGVYAYNCGKIVPSEFVFWWCKNNCIDDGNVSPRIANMIARDLGCKCIGMRLFSKEFEEYLNKGYAVSLSIKAPRIFWNDGRDGDIDNYLNNESGGKWHAVYVVRDVEGDWIINSWKNYPPIKVDLKKLKKSWLRSVRCFTFLP